MTKMTGDIWTGRIYDAEKVKKLFSNDTFLICVMRYAPRYINLKEKGIIHMPDLGPSKQLLKWYKMNKDKLKEEILWLEFLKKFVKEQKASTKVDDLRMKIRRSLLKGATVVLFCHEKAGEYCHRLVLPHLILTDEERETCYRGEITFKLPTYQKKLDWDVDGFDEE